MIHSDESALVNHDSDFKFTLSCRMMNSSNREVIIRHQFSLPEMCRHQDVADEIAVFMKALQFQFDSLNVVVDREEDSSLDKTDEFYVD